MTYMIIIGALLVLALIIILFLFMQRQPGKSNDLSSSTTLAKETATGTPANPLTLSSEQTYQQRSPDRSGSGQMTQLSAGTRITESIKAALPGNTSTSGYPGSTTYPRSQQEPKPSILLSPLTPTRPAHAQGRYELEQEYERGMRTIYDEKVGAVNFITTHVVMNTPAEVELAFFVCKRQIRTVLRAKGLERAPTLTDIGGLVIGREATTAWGQALKNYLEEICIKAGKDVYLLAHYNSQADRPDQDQLQEKIRLIQFMTSAAINNFQSNIFDTREEAVAFLQRMREVYRV